MRFLFLITLTFFISHPSFATESKESSFNFKLDQDTALACISIFSQDIDTGSLIQNSQVIKTLTNSRGTLNLNKDGSILFTPDESHSNPNYLKDTQILPSELYSIIDIQSTNGAFAALREDGRVFVWGDIYNGGDVSSISYQLNDVKELISNSGAFLALKKDNTLVSWGNIFFGGNFSSKIKQPTSKKIVKIKPLTRSFKIYTTFKQRQKPLPSKPLKVKAKEVSNSDSVARLSKDGHLRLYKIVTHYHSSWHHSSKQHEEYVCDFRNIIDIRATTTELIALTGDGKVIVWTGHLDEKPETIPDLDNVTAIVSNAGAFSALRSDGSVFISDDKDYIYTKHTSTTLNKLKSGVVKLFATHYAFCALKDDGSIVTWGDPDNGGDSSKVSDKLFDIEAVYANYYAFIALRKDGTAVSWGDKDCGGGYKISNVKKIYTDTHAFVVLKENNKIVTMGRKVWAEDLLKRVQKKVIALKKKQAKSSATTSTPSQTKIITVAKMFSNSTGKAVLGSDGKLSFYKIKNDKHNQKHETHLYDFEDIVDIRATNTEFIALTKSGKVILWKTSSNEKPEFIPSLDNVTAIESTGFAFSALKQDGTAIIWRFPKSEGDSSLIQYHLNDIEKIYVNAYAFVALRKDRTAVSLECTDGGRGFKISNIKKIIYTKTRVLLAITEDGGIIVTGKKDAAENLLNLVQEEVPASEKKQNDE